MPTKAKNQFTNKLRLFLKHV